MKRFASISTICLMAATTLGACEKEPPPSSKPVGRPAAQPAPPSADPAVKPAPPPTQPKSESPPAMPAGHSAAAPSGAPAATIDGSTLKLTGVNLTVPTGWTSEPVPPTPMAPVAVLKIPKLAPDGEDGTVRITYFPNMKGMDESNISRWIGQVAKPDGQPSTRDDAKINILELGNVRVTTVDLTGLAQLTMRDTPRPNTRMIAAIVDHPKGPHFVVSAGDSKSMETWGDQIITFLKSSKAE